MVQSIGKGGSVPRSGRHQNGIKAVFLTVTGQSKFPGFLPTDTFLSYIIPAKCRESHVVRCFPPDNTEYCHFYSLETLLHGMYTETLNIHPSTREMLATLDNWLGERHSQVNAINQLFQPPVAQRTIYAVANPLHSENSESFGKYWKKFEEEKVDKFVDNPLFGSGLKFKDTPEIYIVNKYFGMGVPDYEYIGMRSQHQPSGSGDWVEEFPLHKFACEGNVDGIRAYLSQGVQLDPNALDTDGWAPLHYACW
uniref:KRIT N-terminal NPxY motif-rich region domain-containing protein n=2 Tax=Amphimedon queenslandica TaxID=400682 RepID=A0A1X7T3Q8_AMPQE